MMNLIGMECNLKNIQYLYYPNNNLFIWKSVTFENYAD